jgi:hypothetical protein
LAIGAIVEPGDYGRAESRGKTRNRFTADPASMKIHARRKHRDERGGPRKKYVTRNYVIGLELCSRLAKCCGPAVVYPQIRPASI